MMAGPVVLRELARQDIDQAVEHFRREAGEKVALRFVSAIERALRHIARFPEAGSPRYGHELKLPGLRSWSLSRYPHVVFYVPCDEHIDVWRVLHGKQDIPTWMRDAETT